MATRSNVSVKTPTGFLTAYHHWDGYPEHNGVILLNSYSNFGKANKLVSMGDVSILADRISCPEGHTFEEPTKGFTTFYKRDRGEQHVDPMIHEELDDGGQNEYHYYHDGEQWFIVTARHGLQSLFERCYRIVLAESKKTDYSKKQRALLKKALRKGKKVGKVPMIYGNSKSVGQLLRGTNKI